MVRSAALFVAKVLVCIGCLSNPCEADDSVTAEELALIKKVEAVRVGVIRKVRPSVVAIFGNNRKGGGSGVLFDSSGLVLTNHHVVAAAGVEGWAGLDDGKLYRWKLIGTDPGGDVAVIRLTGKDRFPFAPLGLSDKVRVGDWVLAIGNPFTLAEDYKPTVTLGIVSGVKRYQPGSGRNMLVYGNCIQVDSSINPGNSGGPLFNMRGEVVGINGRASFKERGRVNVGAGYAISMRQIRNFLPELLATKIARHGTLDAQFGNRRAGVLCEAVNLDSPAAKAGLQLADKLLKFNGEPIRNANEFTNLISMLPEGWPVELVVERSGKQQTIRVRLDAINYGQAPKPNGKTKPPTTKLNLATAGLVRDIGINGEMAGLILRKARTQSQWVSERAKVGHRVFQSVDELHRDGRNVGRQTLTISSDGRFRLDIILDGKRRVLKSNGDVSTEILRDAFGQQAVALAVLIDKRTDSPWKFAIDAADKSRNRRTYRILSSLNDRPPLLLWFSQFDASGREDVRLLKSGTQLDGDTERPCVTYSDYRKSDGIQWPFHRTVVTGLVETPALEIRTRSIRKLPNWPKELGTNGHEKQKGQP